MNRVLKVVKTLLVTYIRRLFIDLLATLSKPTKAPEVHASWPLSAQVPAPIHTKAPGRLRQQDNDHQWPQRVGEKHHIAEVPPSFEQPSSSHTRTKRYIYIHINYTFSIYFFLYKHKYNFNHKHAVPSAGCRALFMQTKGPQRPSCVLVLVRNQALGHQHVVQTKTCTRLPCCAPTKNKQYLIGNVLTTRVQQRFIPLHPLCWTKVVDRFLRIVHPLERKQEQQTSRITEQQKA